MAKISSSPAGRYVLAVITMTNVKKKISHSFSKASGQYDRFALVQRQSVRTMQEKIIGLRDILPKGEMLEIGCGTGSLSRIVAAEIPGNHLLMTDISLGMLEKCKENFTAKNRENLSWRLADGENITSQAKYALIISGLTLQWFTDPVKALKMAGKALMAGGLLLYSYIGAGSFAEWRAVCKKYKINCTANPLPDTKMINDEINHCFSEINTWSETIVIDYPHVADFFNSLKKTGSATSLTRQSLSAGEMRKLLKNWSADLAMNKLQMTYEIQYIMAVK